MKRALRIVVGLAAILAVLAAVAWFLVATESGTRQTIKLVSPWLPEGLATGELSGTLAGPLRTEGLRYESDTVMVSVGHATLDWQPARLLVGELVIDNLTAADIDVELKKKEPPADPEPWRPSDIRLPVQVVIENAAIRSLAVSGPDPGAAPIVIDEAALAGTFDDSGARLVRLSIAGSPLSIEATAQLDPTGDWPMTVDARIDYRLADRAPLAVTAAADGSLRRLTIDANADAPWGLSVAGDLMDLAGSPAIDLTVAAQGADLVAIDARWPSLVVSGRWRVAGNAADATIDGMGTVDTPEFPTIEVRTKASGNLADVELETLSFQTGNSALSTAGTLSLEASGPVVALTGKWSALRWPLAGDQPMLTSDTGNVRIDGGPRRFNIDVSTGIGPGALNADGYVDLSGETPAFDLNGRWQGLATTAPPIVASPEGAVSVRGTLDAYEITLETQVAAAPWATGLATVNASGNQRGLEVERLDVPATGGRITGNGTLGWSDGLGVSANLDIRSFDPGVIWPDIPGRIDAKASLTGSAAGDRREAILKVTQVQGTLMTAPLSGRAHLALHDNTIDVRELGFKLAGATLALDGAVGAEINLNWQLDAPDLSQIDERIAGQLNSTGQIVHKNSRLSVTAELDAQGIEGGPLRVASVKGRVATGNQPGAALDVQLDARGLHVNEREIATLVVGASGTTDRHDGQIALRSQFGGLTARFAGGYAQGAWSGNIDALRAESAAEENAWVLDRVASLTIAAGRIALDEACLVQADASLCADVHWNGQNSGDIAIRLTALPVEDFSPWLPPDLLYSGKLSGEVSLTGRPDGLTGDARLALSPGAVRQSRRKDAGEPALLEWREAGISARLAADGLTATAGFGLANAGRIDVNATVPMTGLMPDPDGPMTADLKATLTDMPLIETLIPDVDKLSGQVSVDVNIAGTLRTPRVTGTARLEDASAELPRLGLALSDTRLLVRASGSQVELEGSARSGDGQVAIAGDFRIADGRWRGDGSLTGERFTAVSLPELSATLSPNLTVKVDHRSLLLEGEVVVPSARIEPRDLAGTVQSSPDAVIVDASRPPGAAEPWQVTSRVRLTLGDNVRIDAFGLKGKIGGSVVAVDKPGKPSTGSGELNVLEATMTAYSQELAVERGRLIFTGGPLSSPGVDIRATRTIDDIVVGVDLRGQLARPEATLFSSPSMSQTETLAYLVLGRPLSSATSGDQGVLGQASMRLGLSGAEFLAQEVGRRIGLDAVEIRATGDESETELVVGKYLSPRLYVSYGLGLFDTFNTVLVRYTLTEDLAVQTETGKEISADIFYTRER